MEIPSLILVVSGVIAGGAGGAAGGAGGFTTTVQSDKRVDQLTDAENKQICADVRDWITRILGSIKPKLCKIAVLSTKSAAECEKAVTDCINKPDEPDSGMCTPPANCTATVGEVEKCTNDQFAGQITLLDMLPTCAQAAGGAQPPSEALVRALLQPASCKDIAKTCPSVGAIP